MTLLRAAKTVALLPSRRLRSAPAVVALAVVLLSVSCTSARSAPTPSAADPTSTATASASPEPTSTAADPTATPSPEQELSSISLAKTAAILQELQNRSSDSDPRYYKDKVWHDGVPQCFRCALGPAVLSAVYGVQTNDDDAIKVSVTSLDYAIAHHQRQDGAFIPAGIGEQGPGIQTVLFANELAQTYLILGSHLDAGRQVKWAASLAKAGDYLIRTGLLRYYINGNLNLALSMDMDLTFRVTRLTRFKAAAQRSLSFTVKPPQDRWKGFGLAYSAKPSRPDGSDGSGYLAESGGTTPGFDPAYTTFQLNMASFWFLLTGDATAKRLTNLFYNQLAPRVRTSDWTIDVSGGTRRTAAGVRYSFYVSALPVLALKGGRTDLADLVRAQHQAALAGYRGATTYGNSGESYSFGAELAPAVLVITSTPGW